MSRILIPEGVKLIRGTEKRSLTAYQGGADPKGVLTIGDGHVIKKGEEHLLKGITNQQADELFSRDCASHFEHIQSDIGAKVVLDDYVYAAFASLAYNNGARTFLGAPSIVDPLRKGDLKAGVLAMWKFCKSGKPLQYRDGLFYRRLIEMYLALSHKLVQKPDECVAARTLMAKLSLYGNTGPMVAHFDRNHRKDLCITCSKRKK